MLSIEDLDDDFEEDKMNNAEVKEIVTMECRRRRRLMSAMIVETEAQPPLQRWWFKSFAPLMTHLFYCGIFCATRV